MISEYHRPETLEAALALLSRTTPMSIPLAGGTAIDRTGSQGLALIDLQSLGLDTISQRGSLLELGAMLRLQALLERGVSEALDRAILLEATHNLRQAASVAGTLVAADGRSPFAAALLALDAQLTMLPGPRLIGLGDLLPVRSKVLSGGLITQVTVPLNVRLAFESIGRSPADRPIVCAALATWPSGRTRLVLGGYGASPMLAFDGAEAVGLEIAARSAFSHAEDEWASAEYRSEMAATLALRCLGKLIVEG